jgi:phosphoglycerate dehydrogenase-like enzyme
MHSNRLLIACALLALLLPLARGIAGDPPAERPDTLIRELGLELADSPIRAHPRWRVPRRVVARVDSAQRTKWLGEVAPGVEIVGVATLNEAIRALPGADVVIGFCEPDLVAAGDQLRWIQVLGAGVEDCVVIDAIGERDIVLTNMQRVAGPVMAEHVFALLLSLTRGIDVYLDARRTSTWRRDAMSPERMRSLSGRTLLVAGLGGIGTEVARLGNAFGMTVVATRASRREGPDFVSHVGLPDELEELAARADVVVNALPLTRATQGTFGTSFFRKVKPGAYFINVGRGATVDTNALLQALEDGRLSGAGLDVTEPEPLPQGHPLFQAPRTIITPHVATMIDTGSGDRWLIARENLRRYVAGEALLSIVDVARGY